MGSRICWAVAAVCLGTWTAVRWLDPVDPEPKPLELSAQWVRSPDPTALSARFRRAIVLPARVRSAWVAVSAWQGFELSVNGATVGRALLRRPTWPFQSGVNAEGQKLAQVEATLGLNFPREYQWEGNSSHQLPLFFDLGPYLTAGENVIDVDVEAQRAPARMILEGQVLLWSGERIRLASDDFTSSRHPAEAPSGWTKARFDDLDWVPAPPAEVPAGQLRRTFDPALFQEPFEGQWLREDGSERDAVWFQTSWRLDQVPSDAWVRVLARGPFQLFINGTAVRVPSWAPQDLDAGEWRMATRAHADVTTASEVLDPDVFGALFGGDRLDVALPSDDIVPPIVSRPAAEWLVGGQPDERGETARPAPPWSPRSARDALSRPAAFPPKELARRPDQLVLYGYGIEALLKAGENAVAVRLAAPEAEQRASWPAALSVDGRARFANGAEVPIGADGRWRSRRQSPEGVFSEWSPPLSATPAAVAGAALPALDYRGSARASSGAVGRRWIAGLALALLGVGLLLGLEQRLQRQRGPSPAGAACSRREGSACGRAGRDIGVLVLPTAFLFAALLVELAWAERGDRLLLSGRWVWGAIGAAALLLGVMAAVARAAGWRLASPTMSRARRLLCWRPDVSIRWRLAAGAVVLLCAFLRVHRLDGQPFDDDELASVQAAVAIAKLGVPRYGPDVYYTRSPLFHYLVGASVKLLGANFWALRLPSVLFAAATALLIYLAGARLLRSRWVGLVAALLYAVHPYAIFVGHLARFYQQQQFFCFLTVYLTCRGFVEGEERRHRLGAVAAFAAACLSQELSVVLALPLLAVVALFTRRIRVRELFELGVATGCALALVVLDVLVFQTRCLTRLEGISPNVEATLSPHFAAPMNALTLFLSYSRLHLGLSLLLLGGLPLLSKRRERNASALAVVLFGGVIGVMLLVTNEALRYQYWLLPLWLLLGVAGTRALAQAWAASADGGAGRSVLGAGLMAMLIGAVLLGWSPWRIPGAYGGRILGDASGAFAFVRANLRPGDAIAATEPHPSQGVLDLGRIDYDLSVPLLQDFVRRQDGRLVDRNGNAEVIGTLEELQDVMARRDRLWVLVSREKFRSRGTPIRWDYPGARFEAFLRENLETEYQTYLWTVFLWDASAGRFRQFRRHAEPR